MSHGVTALFSCFSGPGAETQLRPRCYLQFDQNSVSVIKGVYHMTSDMPEEERSGESTNHIETAKIGIPAV